MKPLKIIRLSLVIWSAGLLWPQINLLLSPAVTVVLAAGLGVLILLFRQKQPVSRPLKENKNGKDHPTGSLPPIAVAR